MGEPPPSPTMSVTSGFRSPSVGIDDWGDVDIDSTINDLCADFDDFYRQSVKSIIDETLPLPPNGGFKLLLMAAIVAYSRTLAPKLNNLDIAAEWRQNMHKAVAEFCNVISFPPIPGDTTPDVRVIFPAPWRVEIPPTPTPTPEDTHVRHG